MNTPVGYIISWTVPKIVELQALRTALVQAGLDPDLAPDLKPLSKLARTSGLIAKLVSEEEKKRLSRPTTHGARQITREEHVNDDLAYTKEAALTLDPTDGTTILCDDMQIAAMVPTSEAEVWTTRRAGDITRIVQRIVQDAGSDLMPVREQGGAYFIPDGHKIIAQLASLLTSIGGQLTQFGCTIGHGTDMSIASVITDYLLKQISELKEAVAELNEKGIRSDVKSRRLSRVAELREKIGSYELLLGIQKEKVTDALNVAEATLLAKLGPSSDDDESVDGNEPPAQDAAA